MRERFLEFLSRRGSGDDGVLPALVESKEMIRNEKARRMISEAEKEYGDDVGSPWSGM